MDTKVKQKKSCIFQTHWDNPMDTDSHPKTKLHNSIRYFKICIHEPTSPPFWPLVYFQYNSSSYANANVFDSQNPVNVLLIMIIVYPSYF
jgi:hypothetical protein